MNDQTIHARWVAANGETGWTEHLNSVRTNGYAEAAHLEAVYSRFGHYLEDQNSSAGARIFGSYAVLQALAYAPEGVVEALEERGEPVTKTEAREAIKQVRDGVDPVEAAKAIDKAKKATAKAKKKADVALAEAAEKGELLQGQAVEIDRLRGELASIQAQQEAAAKGLTVAPPKVVYKENPEKDAALAEAQQKAEQAQKAARDLRASLEQVQKQIAANDELAIQRAGERLGKTSPAAFLAEFATRITTEYLRRLRGAAAIAQQHPDLVSREILDVVAEVSRLCDQIMDAGALQQDTSEANNTLSPVRVGWGRMDLASLNW